MLPKYYYDHHAIFAIFMTDSIVAYVLAMIQMLSLFWS